MKILVVGDEKNVEPLFRMRFRRELRSGGIDFIFAFFGEEALTKLNEHGKAADLDCDGYVSKSIDFSALKEKISSFKSA